MRRVVVTGANRGLGLEFTRQLLASGDEVMATTRHPQRAGELAAVVAGSGGRGLAIALDVADPASVEEAAARIGERFAAVELLVNNAGVLAAPGRPEGASTGSLAGLEPEAVLEVLRINAVGPLAVTRALAPLLAAAGRSTVVNLSSGLGSIAGTRYRGNLAYAMSKAALNMLSRQLGAELRRQGTTVVSMSPGWVSTDMGGPSAPLSPPESVKSMLATIEELGPGDSGRFLDQSGEELPF